MSCTFNPEGRPKSNPANAAECELNWESMGVMWDAWACFAKQTVLSKIACYNYGAVEGFDSFVIPKADLLGAELSDCAILFFKDGVQYGIQTDNEDAPLYITIEEQITQYLITLSVPAGETDALSDIVCKVFVETTVENLINCDDLTCPE